MYKIIERETGDDFADGALFDSNEAVRDHLETVFHYDWNNDNETDISAVSLETILENCNLIIKEIE
jgi:hypothetical protein